ncbi:MAG TPA: carboxypeptidase-like regulatory domain-containing protein, partial [bacterium]|nr:carboxypeptidase-like regulatory domain-containing protein [bacterium]
PVGTVADATGHFRLALPASVAEADTLQVALLGYAPRTWTVRELLSQPAGLPLRVQLAERPALLPAATVRAARLKQERIGNHHYKTTLQTNFALGAEPGQNVGSEIGRVFQLPRGGAWLDRFRFVVCGNTFDTVRLRINVYRLRDGVPREPLLAEPLYRDVIGKRATWVDVDLQPLNLFVDAGEVVVAVEWVGHSRKGDSLGMPLLMPAFATHLYRYGAASRWKRFPGMSTCMELTVTQSGREAGGGE